MLKTRRWKSSEPQTLARQPRTWVADAQPLLARDDTDAADRHVGHLERLDERARLNVPDVHVARVQARDDPWLRSVRPRASRRARRASDGWKSTLLTRSDRASSLRATSRSIGIVQEPSRRESERGCGRRVREVESARRVGDQAAQRATSAYRRRRAGSSASRLSMSASPHQVSARGPWTRRSELVYGATDRETVGRRQIPVAPNDAIPRRLTPVLDVYVLPRRGQTDVAQLHLSEQAARSADACGSPTHVYTS